MARRVVDGRAHPDPLAVRAHDIGRSARIDLYLQRHVELACVAEDALMKARDAGRSGIEIDPVGEAYGLCVLAVHFDLIAIAQRPGTAADPPARSAERRVGEERVSPSRSRW